MDEQAQPRHRVGARQVIVATIVAGGAGYVLTVYAGLRLGDDGYARFAAFWSAVFLVVAAVGGIQQEVARATRRTKLDGASVARAFESRRTIKRFAILAAGGLFAVSLLTLAWWSPRVFGSSGTSLAVAASWGVSTYVFLAISLGLSFGVGAIRVATTLMIFEGVVRLFLTVGALALDAGPTVVAWAIVLPFMLTPLSLMVLLRRSVWNSFEVDVSLQQVTWNAARTIGAATATGVVVSGLPLLVAATSNGVSTAVVSTVMYAITTVRAPLVVVALAFQSFLVVALRPPSSARRVLPRVLLGIGVCSASVAAVAFYWGPGVLAEVLGSSYTVPPRLLAIIVVSAGPVSALFVSGAALLARGMHGPFTLGWLATAALTVVALVLPLDFEARLSWAFVAPPLVGLTIHCLVLAWRGEFKAPHASARRAA